MRFTFTLRAGAAFMFPDVYGNKYAIHESEVRGNKELAEVEFNGGAGKSASEVAPLKKANKASTAGSSSTISIDDDDCAETPAAAPPAASSTEQICGFCTLSNPAKVKKCQACGQKLAVFSPKARAAPKVQKRPAMDSRAGPHPAKVKKCAPAGEAKKVKAPEEVKSPVQAKEVPVPPPPPPPPPPVLNPIVYNEASDEASGDDDFE